jgi:hypothetical protein
VWEDSKLKTKNSKLVPRGVALEDTIVAVRSNDQESSSGVGGTIAVVLARVVVPLWLFAGAVLKLMDLSPTHLPAALIKWLGSLDFNLMFVLRFSIAAELIVAGVMVLVPPLARWIGVAMLSTFVPVLIGDLMLGASSCGCFGAVKVSPWVTLVMDVTFLLGLVVLGRREPKLALTPSLPTSKALIAGLWSLLSVVVAFGLSAQIPTTDGSAGDGTAEVGSGSVPDLPADGYYLPQYDDWIGRPFRHLEIASWVRNLPENIDFGPQFVLFYRKDCEHCHELMELYFNDVQSVPTVAIAVPERDGFPTKNLQPFACSECQLAELPTGIDWFLQTPVLVRLVDGVVECAAEVDPMAPECIDW